MNKFLSILSLAVLACATTVTQAFVAPTTLRFAANTKLYSSSDAADPNEVVGRRIIVTGDVQGGYYRACVNNEAGKFRRLIGTMTPPDDTNEAEIYVEVRTVTTETTSIKDNIALKANKKTLISMMFCSSLSLSP
mmetsp:Transcript_11276/g.15798  ORF Transcript_11276/g.15798 Transcript_11276/m.15798 type:complete len:135 (+) Transcript_11276:116-520(+)